MRVGPAIKRPLANACRCMQKADSSMCLTSFTAEYTRSIRTLDHEMPGSDLVSPALEALAETVAEGAPWLHAVLLVNPNI